MLSYVIRRLIQAAIVMLVVAFVSFSMFTFAGDPVNNMVGQEASQEDRELLRERLGLNDPFIVQFGRFVVNAVQGQFGLSYQLQRPVEDLIAERMPATLELVAVSAVLALAVGIPFGVMCGINRDGWFSRTLLTVSLVGVSLPTFVIGIFMIYLFSVTWGLLPSFGRGPTVDLGWWSTGFLTTGGWLALIMPSITLSLFQTTLILRLVRAEMLEVMRTDYIKFGRARGLSNKAINFGHALRNTLVPVITIAGLNIGSLIAFSIITETVFNWPGMGLLFIKAVEFADVPIMAAYLVMVAFVFVVINLVVDLLYFAVDPRLKIDTGAAVGRLS
ncbi:MAG: ABC transporter permease [Alphaproteobacteria bacterium]|nr:ABC transporter permease [Alphaproteobacteria bacterium]